VAELSGFAARTAGALAPRRRRHERAQKHNPRWRAARGRFPGATARRPADDGHDYLCRVLNARVYDVAIETALDPRRVCPRSGQPRAAQARDLQPVFSFKLRGAYNRMVKLDAAQRRRGVDRGFGRQPRARWRWPLNAWLRAVIVMP